MDVDEALALSFRLMLERRFDESRCLAEYVANLDGSVDLSQSVNADYRLLELSHVIGDMDLAETSGRRLLARIRGLDEYHDVYERLLQRICDEPDWAKGRGRFMAECADWRRPDVVTE